MEKNKRERLENIVEEFYITPEELKEWARKNPRCDAVIIKTPLPIVYRIDNVIAIRDGLELKLKDYVWGIKLLSKLIVSVNNIWQTRIQANACAQRLVYDGKLGRLPRLTDFMDWLNSKNIEKNHQLWKETTNILEQNNVSCDHWGQKTYSDLCWLDYRYDNNYHVLQMPYHYHMPLPSNENVGRMAVVFDSIL